MRRALERCRDEGVETIALLGDLFDRHEQADNSIEVLSGWDVVGVYGNHERETVLAAMAGEIELREQTLHVLSILQEEVAIDDVLLTHEVPHWGPVDPVARMFARGPEANGQHPLPRVTFTGHTHYRQVRDERGMLDTGRGAVTLDPTRRYLINPGALLTGQYAIWDREERVVYFRDIGYP
jgi:predicted phosphodiesterase